MKTENNSKTKHINIQNKFKPLKEIIKEKILYENICPQHHSNYIKFCSTCSKDICSKCEIESHKAHQFTNYETLIPDLKENNILNEIMKEYNKNYNSFINIINNWKKEFDLMINEYEIQMNNIMEYMLYFNNEKLNFNKIYKYRIIFEMLSNGDNTKNDKILKIMEKMDINNEKENIKGYYLWLLNNHKLKDLIKSLNNDSFIGKINKIADIININNKKYNEKKNLENKINKIVIDNILNKNKNK